MILDVSIDALKKIIQLKRCLHIIILIQINKEHMSIYSSDIN